MSTPILWELPIKIPPNYYPAIGEVIYRQALLEFQMQVIIWRALKLDNKKGRTLTIGMGAKTLIGMLHTITMRWAVNKTEIRLIKNLADQASDIYDDRNNLAHGVWMYPIGGNPSVVSLHYMKKRAERIMPNSDHLTPRDVRKIATQIKRLNERAQRLIGRIEKRQTREKQAKRGTSR